MDGNLDLEAQYDKIYRYCYFKLGSRETAEDITQETFSAVSGKGIWGKGRLALSVHHRPEPLYRRIPEEKAPAAAGSGGTAWGKPGVPGAAGRKKQA